MSELVDKVADAICREAVLVPLGVKDATTRAAIAAVFDWLGKEPYPTEAITAGWMAMDREDGATLPELIWPAMLAERRKAALGE